MRSGYEMKNLAGLVLQINSSSSDFFFFFFSARIRVLWLLLRPPSYLRDTSFWLLETSLPAATWPHPFPGLEPASSFPHICSCFTRGSFDQLERLPMSSSSQSLLWGLISVGLYVQFRCILEVQLALVVPLGETTSSAWIFMFVFQRFFPLWCRKCLHHNTVCVLFP